MDWVNPIVKISNKIKFQLFGRNHENLIHLYTHIPTYDPTSCGGMPQHDLNLFLNKSGVFLSTQEIRTLKEQFPHPQGVNYQ